MVILQGLEQLILLGALDELLEGGNDLLARTTVLGEARSAEAQQQRAVDLRVVVEHHLLHLRQLHDLTKRTRRRHGSWHMVANELLT